MSWFRLDQHEIKKKTNNKTPAAFPCLFLINPFANLLFTLHQEVFCIFGFKHFLCLRYVKTFLLHHLCASPQKRKFVGNYFSCCHTESTGWGVLRGFIQGGTLHFLPQQIFIFKDNSRNQTNLHGKQRLCLSSSLVQSQKVLGYVLKSLCVFLSSLGFFLQENQEFFHFHLCESARSGFLFILCIQERGRCRAWSVWVSPTWLLIWSHLHDLPWKRRIWPFSSSWYAQPRSDPFGFCILFLQAEKPVLLGREAAVSGMWWRLCWSLKQTNHAFKIQIHTFRHL